MIFLGDFLDTETVQCGFSTFGGSAESITITGLAVTDIEVYKDGSMTQRASDNGYVLLDTDGIDLDGAIGIHGFSIDLSDNSDAGFYTNGSQFRIVVDAITVNAQTVRFQFSFSIGRLLHPTTAGRTLDILTTGEAAANITMMGGSTQSATDLKDFADDGYDPATNKVQGVVLVDTLTTYTGNTLQTADIATLITTVGVAGLGLTDLGGMSIGMKAEVEVEVDDGIINSGLDHFFVNPVTGSDIADSTVLAALVSSSATPDWDDFDNTTASLQAIVDRGNAAWTTGAGTGLTALASGTAQSGTASTIVLASGEAFADDVLNGNVIKITSGTGAGQSRLIISNTLADDTCNVAPDWTTNPSSDSVYEIVEGAANIEAISLDNPAAVGLEAQYDGTGLTGDTFPATQAQIGGIANVGSAINRPASSYVLTTGTQSANTVSETEALDEVRHEHTDDTGAMELYYEFDIGAGTTSSCQVTGYMTGNNDDVDVYGFDWVASAWVQIGNIQGTNSTSNAVFSFDMFIDMVGSGANKGIVRVRFYKASGLTSATLAIDQIFVAFSQGADGYDNSAVWFDSAASNTNTVVGVDGTSRNPVSSEAAVNTLLASTNLKRVEVKLDSSITFATSHTTEEWSGKHWTLALGGQDISGSHIGGATVSGIGTGTSEIRFSDCEIGTATLHQFNMDNCGLASGILTLGEAGDYVLSKCYSKVAGSATPIIDTGAAIADVNLAMPGYKNGIEIRNLNASGTDVFSISGTGQIIYAASSSGSVNQRGDWKVTNTGGVTITEDDNTANVAALITTIGTLGAGLTDLGGMSTAMKAEVLVEVNAALDTAIVELGVAQPSVTPTVRTGLMLLYMALRNKLDVQTSGTDALEVHNDAGTLITKKLLTDDGADYSEAKMVSGA